MRLITIGFLLALWSTTLRAAADEPASAVHGFADLSLKPDYITPRGLLVTNSGVTSQLLGGLAFVLSPDVSLVGGLWTDIDSDPRQPGPPSTTHVQSWTEFDYFAGINWNASRQLKLSAQYVVFVSPAGVFRTEQNLEFGIHYDDSTDSRRYSLQPYAKLFWAVAGDSTVVTGKAGRTFDVELGLTPTVAVRKVTLTFPTWITVGPAEFWDGRAAQLGFSPNGGNIGVISTGVLAKTDFTLVPSRFGHWYVYGGVQYYNLLNGNLVDANKLTTYGTGHRNIVNPQAGIGFNF